MLRTCSYLKLDDTVQVEQTSYISNSCGSNRSSDRESPTIVGEFSLSPPDNVENTGSWTTSNSGFYMEWFAAQVSGYEKYTNGWIFWTWKTQLGDYRWSYLDAVAAGVIPQNLSTINSNICEGANTSDADRIERLGLCAFWNWSVLAIAWLMTVT